MDPLAEAKQLFLDALALQEKGDLEQAERLYRNALALAPERPSVINNLAAVLFQSKKYAEAKVLCKRRLETDPADAVALLNLGNCQVKLNLAKEALISYEKALRIRPDYADALTNRGNALLELKRPEESLASHDRALVIRPDVAEAFYNRGKALMELKRPEEALASYDRALAIKPDYADAHNNRGNTLLHLNWPEEALASHDRALAIKPDYAEAFISRGNALLELKRPQEALASYDRALAIKPDYAEAFISRGNALLELKRPREALASFDEALANSSDQDVVHNSRGNALHDLKRYEEAVASYEKVLAIRPDFEYAVGMLANAKLHCCDWRARNEEAERLTVDIRAGKSSAPPFLFFGISDSARDQLLCSRIWVRDKYSAPPVPIWKGERYRHDRIRIAYISADFHEHATAYLMAELFETHDRARFETTAISFGPDTPSGMRARLKRALDRFIDVRQKSDRQVAHLLRELEIDIAVDLKGFTTDCRTGIFAHRAAPVQVNYLGYPGTMGADFIDYILTDRLVIPEGEHGCYTEKVVYLPDTYQVNDSKRVIADRTPARTEAGLPEQAFVFCSFNNNYKLNPMVFDVWMRLLSKVEGSVLWLLEGNAAAVRNLRKEATDRGIAPERLVFASRVRLEEHLARHRLADLFLDTLPYNAHTTASDALWAGLPVLTCLGTTFAGRVAASLLNAIGLNELITHSLEEYESLALELATNPKRPAEIKSKLAKNRGIFPLFDTDRFRRHIEAAYTTMWKRYQRGEPPESFAVEPIDD
jgi:protein O-GlcNAc transferase